MIRVTFPQDKFPLDLKTVFNLQCILFKVRQRQHQHHCQHQQNIYMVGVWTKVRDINMAQVVIVLYQVGTLEENMLDLKETARPATPASTTSGIVRERYGVAKI